MPILIAPDLSRRAFLTTLTAGGAALAAGAGRASDGAPWVALVADTHIAAEPGRVVRGNVMVDNLKAVVADILAAPTRPVAVVIDGDLALLDGQPGDYATLIATLLPLRTAGVPVHLTLGNHDDRTHFLDAGRGLAVDTSPLAGKYVGGFEAIGHRFVLLDSLDGTNVTPGVLGEAQVAWLAADLDAHPGRPTLVFVHHNLGPKGEPGLVDDEALRDLVAARAWVKAVVFGHTHTWARSEAGGVHFLNLPAVGYPFAPEQPIGYARMKAGGRGASLELRTIGPDRSRQGETWTVDWRPS